MGSKNQKPSRSPTPGFTIVEILVAVGAVALVAVGLAAIFDSVGKTVAGGRRISQFTSLASLIEDQFRRDFANVTRDGPLVIRQQYANLDQNPAVNPFLPGAGNPDGVDLVDPATIPAERAQSVQQTRRPRRIDELVMFVRGEFKSTRPTMLDGVSARADSARVYYGHGQRRRESDTGTFAGPNSFISVFPDPYDPNAQQDQWNPAEGRQIGIRAADNPNRYASDWTLLRHVTLLAPPRVALEAFTTYQDPGYFSSAEQYADRDAQIAGQPAAPSIFRRLAMLTPAPGQFGDPSSGAGNNFYIRPRPANLGGTYRPQSGGPVFASGVVDIATSDLNEVRTIVNNGLGNPAAATPFRLRPVDIEATGSVVASPLRNFTLGEFVTFDTRPPLAGGTPPAADDPVFTVDSMHAWMADLFPAESAYAPDPFFRFSAGSPGTGDEAWGIRMRYEPVPVGLLEAIDSAPGQQAPVINPVIAVAEPPHARARRADQIAVTASNFVRCTEFIVEWSFGQTKPQGQPGAGELIWYGLERRGETDGVAGITTADTRILARPYPYADTTGAPLWHSLRFRHKYPSDLSRDWAAAAIRPGVPTLPPSVLVPEFGEFRVSDRLIYGFAVNNYTNSPAVVPVSDRSSLTSYFGYVDPMFDPRRPYVEAAASPFAIDRAEGLLPNGNRIAIDVPPGDQPQSRCGPGGTVTDDCIFGDAFDSADPSLPWAWPRLVRITLSLADPREPWIEETYQYVFSLPDEPAPGSRN